MAQLPRNQSQFIAISGGMDLSTPPIAKASSDAVSTLNVQPIYGGGFSRIEGYECLDGKTIPSQMTYAVLHVGNIANKEQFHNKAFTHNGKQYRIIDVLDDAFVVAFLKPETMTNGASFSVSGVSFTASYVNSSIDGDFADDLVYRGKAFQLGVDAVFPVPGTGNIRGVVELNDNLIAFRDDGDRCGVFISSDNSWTTAQATYIAKLKNLVKPENLLDNSDFTSGNVRGV
ncbi:MAG: hypothetical protein E7A90_06745, partial [Haemophilus parainfluenzae]|nr:hypothetical protein [Haemophilus parainfluenzae]